MIKKTKVIPFALCAIISAALIGTGCGEKNRASSPTYRENATARGNAPTQAEEPAPEMSSESLASVESSSSNMVTDEEMASYEDSLLARQIGDYIEAPDDEWDYRWNSDFVDNTKYGTLHAMDSSAYEHTLGFAKPTYEDLTEVIDKNRKLDNNYKAAIREYIEYWLDVCPDTDFTVLYQNLETMDLQKCSASDMLKYTGSSTAVAQYNAVDNVIRINEMSVIDNRSSDDFITFYHELTHAARTLDYKKGKMKYMISFGTAYIGNIIEEAVITNFIYEMQGMGKKSEYYSLPCNYMRIIIDCLDDYSWSDYVNHSVVYLADQMDQYMGDESGRALYMLHIMEVEYEIQMHRNHDKEEIAYCTAHYPDMYEYIVRMYCKKHLDASMSKDEAEQTFDTFMDEITFNFDTFGSEYQCPEITEEAFRPYFDAVYKEVVKLGV